MHYNITKKHTLSLHVKNIDIKNYAINSATAVVDISLFPMPAEVHAGAGMIVRRHITNIH